MTTVTTKARYRDGIVIPEVKPLFTPRETLVIFVPPEKKGNAPVVLDTLKNAKGALPKSMDGITYETKTRKRIHSGWQKRITQHAIS